MIPNEGEVCIALLRHRVKVLTVDTDDDTANVALIPDIPLPDDGVIIMNGVPFKFLTTDDDE